MTLAMFKGTRATPRRPQRHGKRAFGLAGFVVVGVILGGVAFYFAAREPGQDPGLPRPATAHALGVHTLPVAMPLPSLPRRPKPKSESPPRNGEGTPTAPATPITGGDIKHHAASPEPAAEAPVLVPEGEQRR
jgi:hypothetical protein